MSELKVEIAKLINEVEFLIKKKTSGKIKENEKEKIEEYLEKLQHEINIKKKEQDELKHKKVDRMIKNEYEKIYVYNSSNKGKNVEEIKKQRDEETKF
jgi:molecular chaperone DnaK (HSP70)